MCSDYISTLSTTKKSKEILVYTLNSIQFHLYALYYIPYNRHKITFHSPMFQKRTTLSGHSTVPNFPFSALIIRTRIHFVLTHAVLSNLFYPISHLNNNSLAMEWLLSSEKIAESSENSSRLSLSTSAHTLFRRYTGLDCSPDTIAFNDEKFFNNRNS